VSEQQSEERQAQPAVPADSVPRDRPGASPADPGSAAVEPGAGVEAAATAPVGPAVDIAPTPTPTDFPAGPDAVPAAAAEPGSDGRGTHTDIVPRANVEPGAPGTGTDTVVAAPTAAAVDDSPIEPPSQQAGTPSKPTVSPAARPPRPGRPRPGAVRPWPIAGRPKPAAPAAVSPVPAAGTQPGRWGRVDIEGTIYLRTTGGERVVGSWQAGAPAEGLAHFARRFDDLLTEVELLAARLDAGGGDPKQTLSAARTLRGGLAEAAVVGDVDGLATRLDDIIAGVEQAIGVARSARDAQRAGAVARKEALADEAEALAADGTQWKQAGDRFSMILDEWRTIRGIDRKADELLWKRFSKAREAFNRRRGSHFADLDRQRAGARTRKEELVAEAEKLVDSEDWGPTAARFRELMTEWKAAGRAQKDADDTLWQRFRCAQDAFFARRSATFADQDTELVANGEAKRALLAEAERIDVSDPGAARASLRDVQARWEAIGKVPRDDVRLLDARLRAVEDRVRDAAERQWRRTDPETEARVAQFRDRVAQFEAQADKARAAGDARRAEQASSQAAQWREWLTTAEQAVQQR